MFEENGKFEILAAISGASAFRTVSTGVAMCNLRNNATDYISVAGKGNHLVAFEIENLSTDTALDDFAICAQPHVNAGIYTLLSGTDWASVTGLLRAVSGGPKTVGAGAKAYAYVDVGPCYSLGFKAKSAGTDQLTNGTFTGSASGWTLGTGWTYGTNKVSASNASATLSQAVASMGTPWVDGEFYTVTLTVSGYSAGTLLVGSATSPGTDEITANGTYQIGVFGDGGASGLVLTGAGFTGAVDNISLINTPRINIRGTVIGGQ